MKSTPRTITKETRHALCAGKYGHCPAAKIWIPSSDGNIKAPRLLVAKSTSTMVPCGVAEISQLWQSGPYQAHRMVSQSVPSGAVQHPYARNMPSHRPWYRRPNSATAPPMCCGQPTTKHSNPDGWYRRSVPTVGNLARTSPRKPRTPTARYRRSVPSESEPTHHRRSVPSRQRPPHSHLECAAPGRSSQWTPTVALGPSTPWSLLECAAPRRSSQCGTRGVSHKSPRPTVLQINELDLGRHVRKLDRVSRTLLSKTTTPHLRECILRNVPKSLYHR